MAEASSIDPTEVARFSGVARSWWDPTGPFAPLHALNPARLAFIRETLDGRFGGEGRSPFAGRRLLDIGCGGGLVAEPMRRLGFAVTAIDADAEGIGVARAHAAAGGLAIDYRLASAEALVAAGEDPFDVVLALEVVEHVAEPGAFVSDCARLMAPGGVMVLATLNRTLRALALAKMAAEYLLRWAPPGTHDWRKFMTPAELASRLEAAGLVSQGPFGLAFDPLRGRWRRSPDASVNYFMIATAAT
jgi:2-polyprenyl-6-hydroxyphenyl methylase/3-demethylubiquinone-9 3-methyltransferase